MVNSISCKEIRLILFRQVPKQTTEDQTRMSEKQDNDNILPEDRFHLNDLLSQHIKQERAQGREKREMEHAEKERVRAKEEAAKKKKEEAAAKEKALRYDVRYFGKDKV